MFILFADFIFKSVFITLKVTNLELFFVSLGISIVLISLPRLLSVVKNLSSLLTHLAAR